MSDPKGGRWQLAAAWYAARPKREQWILAGATLAVVWALIDALWLSPVTRDFKAQLAAQSQKQAELAQFEAQLVSLKETLRTRDAERRRDTEATRARLAEITGQLAEFERALVPARQMPDFLRSLLPGAGVEIVALRTLAPTPLIIRPPRPDGDAGALPAAGAAADKNAEREADRDAAGQVGGPSANLYQHGIEITLAGNYDALLGYLARLEKAPQKVLWGRLELKVDKHPRNELTLVLYTLSLDPSWLVV